MNIHDSLHQILASKKIFGEYFYETFFQQCPAAKQYFQGVNLERQAVLLTMALLVIDQQYRNPYAVTAEYLRYLGTKHHDRNIPQHLYASWCDAMLITLEQFHGDDWDAALRKQWQEAIEIVTELMFQGYSEHYTV